MCGFIAQLVEQRTGNAEVMGSNPVEALIFFRLLLSSCLRWLDWIFLGGYLPCLSINYVAMSKDRGKRLTQLYYIKKKISYDLGFIAIGVTMAT